MLGEDGKEATEFAPGTDIFISLTLINSSEKPFAWEYAYECHLFQREDFLMVYKRNKGGAVGDWIPLGRPYQSPVYCLMMNVPPRQMPPGETGVFKFPWSANPANHPLSAVEYYVVAHVELSVEGETRTWDMIADFEM